MKTVAILGALMLLVACPHSPHSPQAQSEPPAADLSWMTGCWQHSGGATQEHWSIGFETLMFGYSVTVSDGEVRAFEDLRIQPGEKGGLQYHASPNGSDVTVFTAINVADQTIVFANAAHDYPQKIEYTRTSTGLTASISMLDGSDKYLFAMTACE